MRSPESRVLALVSGASAISSLDLSLMFVAYPRIRADFADVPLGLVSWVLTSFTIVAAALLIPAGRVADRLGRRKVFLAALVLFAVGSGLCAVSPVVPMLIAARIVQAVGGAMLTPAALAIIMSTFPVGRRAWAVGVWSTVNGGIATMGPTIGALLIRYASWRWAFVINLVIGLVGFAIGRRVLTESVDPQAGPLPDLLGVGLVMAGVATLAFAIVQTESWGWTAPATVGAFGTAGVLLATLVRRCRRHPVPVIDLAVFRPFLFKANAVAAVAIGITFWGGYYVFVQFLTAGWEYTIVAAGLLLIPMTLAASFVGIPAGRLMDRIGHRAVMVPAAGLFALAMIWLSLRAGDGRAVVAVWIPAALAIGVTNAVYFPGVTSAGAKAASAADLAITAGIVQTLIRIGGATGAALGVALVGEVGPGTGVAQFRPSFVALAVIGLVAAAAALPLATSPRHLLHRAAT